MRLQPSEPHNIIAAGFIITAAEDTDSSGWEYEQILNQRILLQSA